MMKRKENRTGALRVWAPDAAGVELESEAGRRKMVAVEGGWWEWDGESVGAGEEYGFRVDGGEVIPDPRSLWQPHGVHGRSRVYDQEAFEWTDKGWQAPPLGGGILYELHIGTFTGEGTFDAAVERLDHLVELGVTHVEVMPVNAFPGKRGWGYDGVSLYAVHEPYGGPDGFKRFVDAAHGKGLAVILDVVYNHLGPSGNYLGQYGPYFTEHYATPWGAALNFDQAQSREVRRFFCDNALMWLREYHVDGLRLDAVHAILDTSATHFLEQLQQEVEELSEVEGRHLFLIAESDLNDPRLLYSRERGGYGLAAQWSDDFHHALHAVLTGERTGYYADFGSLADLGKALENVFVYDGIYSSYRQRPHGRAPAGLSGHRFLGYLQNHDQVGNRAQGDRVSAVISPGRLKIGAALVLFSPFVPMLFQGEEWGAKTPYQYFTDHQEPELGKAVREGRKREFAAFGWDPEEVPDPQAEETFERSKLDWSELKKSGHKELYGWYRACIELRRKHRELRAGDLGDVSVRYDEEAGWLTVSRGGLLVAVNLGLQEQVVPLREAGQVEVLMSSNEGASPATGGVQLGKESVAVCKAAPER